MARRTTKATLPKAAPQPKPLPRDIVVQLANKRLAEGMAKLQTEILEEFGCRVAFTVPTLVCEDTQGQIPA